MPPVDHPRLTQPRPSNTRPGRGPAAALGPLRAIHAEYDVADEPEASAVRSGQCHAIRAALAWLTQHPNSTDHGQPDTDLRRAA